MSALSSSLPTASASVKPYFEGVVPSAWQQAAKTTLMLPITTDNWFKAEMAKAEFAKDELGKDLSPLKRFVLERLHWIGQKVGKWDISSVVKVNLPGISQFLGSVPVTRSTITVLALWLYGFLFPTREYLALKRQRPDDLTKETTDVAIRDLTSFALALYILDPLVRLINKNVSGKLAGLPLTEGMETLPYSEIAERYSIRSPQQLQTLLKSNALKAGIKKALNELSDRGLAAHGDTMLAEQVTRLKGLLTQAMATPDDMPLVKQAFDQLGHLNATVKQIAHQAVNNGNSGLLNKANKVLQSYNYQHFLTYYANRFRVPADLISLVAVVGLAGWLPMAINNFFSLRAVEKYKQSHPYDPSAPHVAPHVAPAKIGDQKPSEAQPVAADQHNPPAKGEAKATPKPAPKLAPKPALEKMTEVKKPLSLKTYDNVFAGFAP
jgi:hypothetical protein